MSEPRIATRADIPFLADLARECYPTHDLRLAEVWAERVISAPNADFIIIGEAVCTVSYQVEMWNPSARIADVLPMFGKPDPDNPMGVYTALKAASEWAKNNNCYGLRFGSSKGAMGGPNSEARDETDLFAPFAKRLGAEKWGVTYMMELVPCRQQFQ